MANDKPNRLIPFTVLLLTASSLYSLRPAIGIWFRLWRRGHSPLAFALVLSNGLIAFIAALRALEVVAAIIRPVDAPSQIRRGSRVGLIVWAAAFLLSLVQYGLARGHFRLGEKGR